jgi:hypothetical protein
VQADCFFQRLAYAIAKVMNRLSKPSYGGGYLVVLEGYFPMQILTICSEREDITAILSSGA